MGAVVQPRDATWRVLLWAVIAIILLAADGAFVTRQRKDALHMKIRPRSPTVVAPGKQVNVIIDVKKARHHMPALLEVDFPVGVLFVGPTTRDLKRTQRSASSWGKKGTDKKGTPAPTPEPKDNRHKRKHFPLPDTVINGIAGEKTLQWHLPRFVRRYDPIKLTFEVDFCGAPSELRLDFRFQQAGRVAQPASVTVRAQYFGRSYHKELVRLNVSHMLFFYIPYRFMSPQTQRPLLRPTLTLIGPVLGLRTIRLNC